MNNYCQLDRSRKDTLLDKVLNIRKWHKAHSSNVRCIPNSLLDKDHRINIHCLDNFLKDIRYQGYQEFHKILMKTRYSKLQIIPTDLNIRKQYLKGQIDCI